MALTGGARAAVLFPPAFKPERLPGCQFAVYDASPITRAAGMATAFVAASSQYLSRAGSAPLWGSAAGWWRSGWLRPTIIDGSDRIGFSCYVSNNGNGIYINGNKLRLSVGTGSGVVELSHPTVLIVDTDYFWYVEYDGTNIGISLNGGALTQQALGAAYSPGTAAFHVGSTPTPGIYFDGRQSALYGGDGVLTSAQIAALYNSGTGLAYDQVLAAGITPLFAYSLNEPSGDRVDQVGALNLTATNTPGTAAGVVQNVVSQWGDLSGNGNHAAMATQNRKPEILRDANGRRELGVDNTDDRLTLAGSGINLGNTHTICYVRTSKAGSAGAILGGASPRYVQAAANDTSVTYRTASNNINWSTGLAAGTPYIAIIVRTPLTVECFINGTSKGVQAVLDDSTTYTALFDNDGGGMIPATGKYKAFVLANTAISNRVARQLSCWASQRFGIALTG